MRKFTPAEQDFLAYLTELAIAHLKNPREQRKQQAAGLDREIAVLADELRRSGVPDPVAQAEKKVAAQLGKSGPALNRWLRRNR